MATEVLRPQDCLMDRMRIHASPAVVFPRRSPGRSGASGRKLATAARKRLPEPRKAVEEPAKLSAKKMVMGQVSILKRGESMPENRIREFSGMEKKPKAAASMDLSIYGTERLGPNPALVPTVHGDVYAGTAFFQSPEPSDLPLPKFSKKKASLGFVDDSATKDLRRLLRLE